MNARQTKKDKICAYIGGGVGGGGGTVLFACLEFLVPQVREFWIL